MFCPRLPQGRRKRWVIIYLQLLAFLLRSFPCKSAPTIVCVARSRGLPRSTKTVSRLASSLWHFQGYFGIARALAIFLPLLFQVPLAYCFARHDHYKASQLVRAWTFLSIIKVMPQLPENHSNQID